MTRTPLRFALSVLVGAVTYYVLLTTAYKLLDAHRLPPVWWAAHVHSRGVATFSWFILIDATCAFIAAVPVALALLRWGGPQRKAIGLGLGVLTGLYVMSGALLEYGVPTYPAAWVVGICQLVSLSTAVLMLVVLLSSRPLTTRWSAP